MPKTIMIVDDEADIRETIKTILEREGYNTILAIDGDDCLKKLETVKPNLILLDIMMPGTPVRDIVKKIKGIKIVYCSAVRTSDAEREQLLSNGNIIDFIQKPFDINELIKKVKKMA
ncbi:response regulator [Candidatus Woesearchaeota archaeon]|nr:response regulator [Candidatus Woesearchaeota archaeon]